MSGRRVLITGASKGIGAACARALSGPQTTLWLNYRSDGAAAEQVAAECSDRGAAVELMAFDVSDQRAVDEVLGPRLIPRGPDTVDVLINNAAVTSSALFAWVTADQWRAVNATNLDGVYAVTHAVIKGMLRKRWGRIINLTSVAGQRGNAGQTAYGASKAGVIGFSKSLALEVASRGITVNAVSPGLIETRMTENLPPDKLEQMIPLIPAGRCGRPEEVASVVRFVASDEASYLTGQVIGVNGGMHT